MTTKVSLATLAQVSLTATVPHYNLARLKTGIMHFGVGNFHRAHQATYLDDLFNLGEGHDWAIAGAGVRAADGHMRLLLERQDWLSTIVEEDGHRTTTRVLAPMAEFLEPGETDAILDRLEDPAIRIVSLTITPDGYYVDPDTGHFDADHPDVVADAEDINAPRTVIGLIVSALRRRWNSGAGAFTILSCDDMPENGRVAASAVLDLAAMVEPELAGWVRANATFPNSIARRTVRAASDEDRHLLERSFGIEAVSPVFAGPDREWIIEDNFAAGRPALEKVGVRFVDDINALEGSSDVGDVESETPEHAH